MRWLITGAAGFRAYVVAGNEADQKLPGELTAASLCRMLGGY
jgi:hypothetical protein